MADSLWFGLIARGLRHEDSKLLPEQIQAEWRLRPFGVLSPKDVCCLLPQTDTPDSYDHWNSYAAFLGVFFKDFPFHPVRDSKPSLWNAWLFSLAVYRNNTGLLSLCARP